MRNTEKRHQETDKTDKDSRKRRFTTKQAREKQNSGHEIRFSQVAKTRGEVVHVRYVYSLGKQHQGQEFSR